MRGAIETMMVGDDMYKDDGRNNRDGTGWVGWNGMAMDRQVGDMQKRGITDVSDGMWDFQAVYPTERVPRR